MGQYLMIGLTTEVYFEKEAVKQFTEKHFTDLSGVLELLRQKHVFNDSLFDLQETDTSYYYTLKNEVFEQNLLPFLSEFYPTVFRGHDSKYQAILKHLQESPPSSWMKMAEDTLGESFQLDSPLHDSFEIKMSWDRLRVQSTHIILAIEGKILMECYGTLFHLFEELLYERFKDFPLSKLLRVYIS